MGSEPTRDNKPLPEALRELETQEDLMQSGIYFLVDDTDEVVYVGQSLEPMNRVKSHTKEGTKRWSRFFFMQSDTRMMNDLEAYYILRLKPKYNERVPHNSFYSRFPRVVSFAGGFYGYQPSSVNSIVVPEARRAEKGIDPVDWRLLARQAKKAARPDSDYFRRIEAPPDRILREWSGTE